MSARDEIVRAITHVQAGSLDCRKGGLAEQAADASLAALRDAGYAVVKLDDPKAIDKVADVLKHRWGFHDPVRSSYQATARRALAALGEPEAKEANDG